MTERELYNVLMASLWACAFGVYVLLDWRAERIGRRRRARGFEVLNDGRVGK